MSTGPDLFVVCKRCGSEVSPYITECPYCGARLQKRAPKLERGALPKTPRRERARRTSLPRLRPGEIPGIRPDRRPVATWALVLAAVAATVAQIAGAFSVTDVALYPGVKDPWRAATTLFIYQRGLYEAVTLGAVALFGWLLERRHGPWAPILVFLLAGAGGVLAAMAAGETLAFGGLSGALGLVGAWAGRDLLGGRRGHEDDSDMLGGLAIAAVLLLMPAAVDEASAPAAIAGAVIGLVLGLPLARLRER